MDVKYFNLENGRKKLELTQNCRVENWPKNSIRMGEK